MSRATRRHRGLLSAGLAAAAVAVALPILAPSPAPTVRIIAASHDLVAGTPLTASDLAVVTWPRSVAPVSALASLADAVGRVLAGPVRTGEALTDVRLVGSSLLTRGGRLVAAPVRLADPATAGLLHAGDRVDVLAVRTNEPQAVAATVASGLSVLAVPTSEESDPDGALVVLAATPETAARLAAAAVGSRLSITVLAP
ncbi:MAG: Flp pilus assembly protein CpaB [Pseudonocardiales bacterium]|nr:Flp pilus assembly protein CpaB [Pseudonocardiales bacterium]